ncbi:CTD kinase subunit beta [Neolecta irregularis DAH-3]|uniref:CTD kinase subunit beta n=1 Tax=Neolecta irregularis (strain DAH-3) TaxID=1198029 RepID=A0A1U7LMD0_NEOID|nr:CTD kinase subunit beta [Neolecta irregularis DAH-3]|eukprot:OLL23788.1 CTD kinase subunit beta [Neolecta irregularis DAH-3]
MLRNTDKTTNEQLLHRKFANLPRSPSTTMTSSRTPITPATPASPLSKDSQQQNQHPPSVTILSRPYLTSSQIFALQKRTRGSAISEQKETQIRLQACAWIAAIGEHMHFPIRTIGTGMMLYHRFHLFYPITDFPFMDMAITCLFVASKMQDTIKKLRDILIVGYQIRHPNGPDINPESQTMEDQRKRVIGLERMVLEIVCFDFRGRHAQGYLIKLTRYYRLNQEVARTAWKISVDCYRTFIPLKHTPQTIALSCLEFSGRLSGQRLSLQPESFCSKRVYVEAVIQDLLELYIHFRLQTIMGNVHSEDDFMAIGIAINRESTSKSYSEQPNDDIPIPPLSSGDRGIVRYVLDRSRMEDE